VRQGANAPPSHSGTPSSSAPPRHSGASRNPAQINRGTRALRTLAVAPCLKRSAKRAHYSLDSRFRGNGGVGDLLITPPLRGSRGRQAARRRLPRWGVMRPLRFSQAAGRGRRFRRSPHRRKLAAKKAKVPPRILSETVARRGYSRSRCTGCEAGVPSCSGLSPLHSRGMDLAGLTPRSCSISVWRTMLPLPSFRRFAAWS